MVKCFQVELELHPRVFWTLALKGRTQLDFPAKEKDAWNVQLPAVDLTIQLWLVQWVMIERPIGGSPCVQTPSVRIDFLFLADRWMGKFYSTTNRSRCQRQYPVSDETQPHFFSCESQVSRSVSCVANVEPIEILGNAFPR